MSVAYIYIYIYIFFFVCLILKWTSLIEDRHLEDGHLFVRQLIRQKLGHISHNLHFWHFHPTKFMHISFSSDLDVVKIIFFVLKQNFCVCDENLCIKECVHICVFVNALSWLSVVDLEKGKRMSVVHINEIYI